MGRKIDDKERLDAELFESREPEMLEADTVAAAEPTVALATAALTPFMARAVADSCANPTEAGL